MEYLNLFFFKQRQHNAKVFARICGNDKRLCKGYDNGEHHKGAMSENMSGLEKGIMIKISDIFEWRHFRERRVEESYGKIGYDNV